MNIISTKRLTIRSFKEEDWKDLHEYLSDEEVVKYEPYGVFSEEEAKHEAINRANNQCFYAVCFNEKVIGNLYLGQGDFDTWEIGYVFNRAYQGQGYATESAQALVDYAFSQLGARRLIAMCNPKNVQSWRLLERLRLRREGTLLQNIFFKRDAEGKPIWCDTYEYGILKSEWIANAEQG